MRHLVRGRKLNRSSAHRKALGRNLFREIIKHHRIITTVEKAKHYRPMVEKLITLARDAATAKANGEPQEKYVHSMRRAMAIVPDRDAVSKLFNVIGPHFKDRPGGYTRILRLGKNRLGDNGSRAIFELVDLEKATPEDLD